MLGSHIVRNLDHVMCVRSVMRGQELNQYSALSDEVAISPVSQQMERELRLT